MKHLIRRVLAAACLVAVLSGCAGSPRAEAPKPASTYAFWPQFPDDPRVQFLASYGSSEDVAPSQMSGLEQIVFGKEAAQAALINKPYGVAMGGGKIYVCDMRSKALVVLDLQKKQTRLVGTGGFNQLEHPVAVALAPDGMIYVADNARGAVFVYDASERYSSVIGFPKFKPVSLAVAGNRLYAADLGAQEIVILDRTSGQRLGTIGGVGDEDGQFRVPLGVSTDRAGNVYVVDMMRCRVQKFAPDGKLLSAMGSLGDYAGSFARPKHMAVDPDGIVYVVDAAFQNVQMFDDQNRLLMHFGAAGTFPGAMDLPAGIAVCDDSVELFRDKVHPGFAARRLIVVTNQLGPRKVSVYALGERRAGYTARDLAAGAAAVSAGVGAPSAEMLKLQTPGGIEPGAGEEGEGTRGNPEPPAPPKQ